MKTSSLLNTGFVIGLALLAQPSCVARECTAEEEREVEATGGDECTTFTPPVQHNSDDQVETLDYAAGTPLVVTGDFRNLEIEQGSAGEIEVTYHAVVDLAEGRSDEQVEATLDELAVNVTGGDSITVSASRSGDSNVAAWIQVRIPPEFDGNITLEQDGDKNHGGEVEISGIASVQTLNIDLNSSNTDLTVGGSLANVERATISVNGFSELATSTFDSPNFAGAALDTESGDIRTSFATVPTGADVKVQSESGNISIKLPGTGNYTMQATSEAFEFSDSVPSTCESATNAGGGSLTCNEGSDTVTFALSSEGSIDVTGFVEP
jgi:hypothetical protein